MRDNTTQEATRGTLQESTERLLRMAANRPSDAEIEKRRAERAASEHWNRVADLTASWNAPKRQASTKPEIAGPWGEKRNALSAIMGTGCTLAFIGARGTGKTQMAIELMRHVIEAERAAYFVTAMEFFMRIKATYRNDARQTEADVMTFFERPSLLVIDEIARRGETEWENNLLFELINTRYEGMTDTIMISNLSVAELKASIGASVISRTLEGGGVVDFCWPSFRGAQ